MVGPLVEVWLPYGSSEVPARIPAERLVDVLGLERQPDSHDYLTEAKQTLESNEPMSKIASESKRTCIAVGACGHQQTATELVGLVVQFLASKSTAPIVILRTQDAPDLQPSALSQATILNHDPVISQTTALPGFNGPFTVQMNSDFLNADLKILIGELKPHALLKFEGLTDMILPGLTSLATRTEHVSNRTGLGLADLYRERVQVTESVENVFMFGFVLPDGVNPIQFTCESSRLSLETLAKAVETTFAKEFTKKADIVVMGAGGKPADGSLARVVETLPVGLSALKKNGTLILAAECEYGHGDGEFYDWCAEGKEARYLEARLRRRLNYGGFKASLLRRTLDSHRVYLISTIPDHYVESIFKIRPARTISAALLTAQRTLGSDATISVIPNANRVIPKLIETQKQALQP